MSRRAAGWVLGIALLLVAGSLAWWWHAGHSGGRRGRHGAAGADADSGGANLERRAFDLYFPSGAGLRAERRELQVADSPQDRIRKILTALLAGPTTAAPAPAVTAPAKSPAAPGVNAPAPAAPAAAAPTASTPAAAPDARGGTAATASDLVRPFPPEVKLGAVELSADGTAFVDLRWQDHEDPPESGSTEELQRVYSLVNSLALNVPQVVRVVLLWNGTQRVTFSGHLDTSRPLVADRTLLAP